MTETCVSDHGSLEWRDNWYNIASRSHGYVFAVTEGPMLDDNAIRWPKKFVRMFVTCTSQSVSWIFVSSSALTARRPQHAQEGLIVQGSLRRHLSSSARDVNETVLTTTQQRRSSGASRQCVSRSRQSDGFMRKKGFCVGNRRLTAVALFE